MQGEDTCEGGGCSPVHKWIGRPLTGGDHLEAQCGFPCKQTWTGAAGRGAEESEVGPRNL